MDGTPLKTLGTAWVELKIGRTTYPVNVIFADISLPAMLGMDWLLPTCGNLDFRNMELNLNGERIKCQSGAGETFVGRVVVTETTVIPAWYEAMVAGAVRQPEGLTGPMMLEPISGGGGTSISCFPFAAL